jgi:fido (protein-threonine AMPylation protein)
MQFVLDGRAAVCRAERICDKVDGRTLELAHAERGKLSLSAIGLLGEQITDGHAQARQAAEYFGGDVPKTVDALVVAAERLHHLIFGATGLSYAGRIRSAGDQEVVVDRGRHQLVGASPAHIRAILAQTLTDSLPALLCDDPVRLARGGAILLEGLFRAHPFLDGNGRVGRLLVRIYVQRSGRYQLLEFDNRGRSVRKYLNALRYVRRKMRDDATSPRCDPYRYLAEWLRRHIVEVGADF